MSRQLSGTGSEMAKTSAAGPELKAMIRENILADAPGACETQMVALEPGEIDARQARARDVERILVLGVGPQPVLGNVVNTTIAREARVRIRSLADIVVARQQGRALASLVGFSSSNLTMIATAISEVTRNIVEYAGEGEVAITLINESHKRGVKIVASDEGPGIADLTAVMRDGFSTGQGLGIGLPGARRLMDEFEISSEIARGTTITMKKWL